MNDLNFTTIALSSAARERLRGQNVRLLTMEIAVTRRNVPCDFLPEWTAVRATWRGCTKEQLRAHPVADAYVQLYQALGINANKMPPSAVNLVTRFAIAGGATKELLRSHPAVDAGNVVQAETLLPVAIFDAAAIEGELLLDAARVGDTFLAFGFKEPEPVRAERLVLRDSTRVISELCYRDCQVTAVTASTSRLRVVIPVAPNVSDDKARSALLRLVELLERLYDVKL